MTVFKRSITAFHIAIIGMFLLLLMIILQGVFFYKQYSKAEESRKWIAHTYEVISAIRTPFAKIKDAQIAQRGYLLTGNDDFLEPYYAAIGDEKGRDSVHHMGYLDFKSFDDNISELRVLVHDNPIQLESLEKLDLLLKEEMQFISDTIETYKLNRTKSIDMVRSGHGQHLMNEIRTIITEMMARERELLAQRLANDKKIESAFTWCILLSALITYSGLLITIVIITQYFGRIRRVEKELKAKETYFRAAAEGGIDAFFIFSAINGQNGKIVGLKLQFMNEVAAKMLDVPAKQLLDKKLPEVLSYNPDAGDEYIELLTSGKVREAEYSIETGVQAGKSYQEQVVPIADGLAISCRDITDTNSLSITN